jgi:hypothetical protein
MHYAPRTIILEKSKLVYEKYIMLWETFMLAIYLEDTSCFFYMSVIVTIVNNVSFMKLMGQQFA